MRQSIGGIVAVLVVLILLASTSLYTVDQRQNAIVFQLGDLPETRAMAKRHHDAAEKACAASRR